MGAQSIFATFARAGLLALSLTACSRCNKERKEETALPVEAPVAAPSALLADIVIPSPNATWKKLQGTVGGAVGILPTTAGGIVCALLGFDPGVADEIDGALPAYGVVAGDPTAASFVFAMKLVDVRHARNALLEGETARFNPRESPGMTELVAKNSLTAPRGAAAITRGGYLLLASRSQDLVDFGPYAARTLPSRPPPTDGAVVVDVPRSAIADQIAPKLSAQWSNAKTFLLSEDERARKDHGGRVPDYGDPKVIVAALDGVLSKRIAVVGDLESMHVALNVTDDGITAVTTLTPMSASGAASAWANGMHLGDAAPLLELPLESSLAVLARDDAETSALDLETVATSSPRLDDAGKARVHAIAGDVSKARGDWIAAAVSWDETRTAFLRLPVRDADAADRAARGVTELLRVTPFKDVFHVRDVTTGTQDLAGIGRLSVAEILPTERTDPPRPKGDAGARRGPHKLAAGWRVADGQLTVALGEDAALAYRAGALPPKKLADEHAVTEPIAAVGPFISTLVVAQPLRLDPKRASLPAAPLVLVLGQKEKRAFVRLSVASGLLREAARGQIPGL